MSSEDDHAKGAVNNVVGKIKEGIGKLTGNESLETEGHVDQAKGKGQSAIGDVKDAFKK